MKNLYAVFVALACMLWCEVRSSPLGEATGEPDLAWTTGGAAEWFGQSETTPPGTGFAAQSGVIGNSESTWARLQVRGPGNIKFRWKISSEPVYDRLSFSLDGSEQAALAGEVDWEVREYRIAEGVHSLEWLFARDSGGEGGQNSAWLGGVSYLHGQWKLDSLGPRACPGMAYDLARERVIMFGGEGNNVHGDTWSYTEETSWTLLREDGPPARTKHAVAYDAERDRMVLFGGMDRGRSLLGDTWEWDGTSWTRRDVSGPNARYRHSMVYDPVGKRVLLFGGTAGFAPTPDIDKNDLWQWDGSAWTQLSEGGTDPGLPTARSEAGLAYDTLRECLVLYGGGWGASGFHSDTVTWEWDAVGGWRQAGTLGPAARKSPSLCYDGALGRTVMFGGYTSVASGTETDETWEWEGTKWSLATGGTVPPARHSAGMVFDKIGERIVLFGGGYEGKYYTRGDAWVREGTAWRAVPGVEGPIPPTGFSPMVELGVAYDSARHRVVAFGGIPSVGAPSHLWEYYDGAWTLNDTVGQPPSLFSPILGYHEGMKLLVLFGGLIDGNQTASDDTWVFDGESWTLLDQPGPPAGYIGRMTYDSEREELVFLGGGQTWTWDGQWHNAASTGPNEPYGRHSICYAPPCSESFVVDGQTKLWGWNGSAWALHTISALPDIIYSGVGYVPASGRMVVQGGMRSFDSGPFDITGLISCDYEWRRLPTTGPIEPRASFVLTDQERGLTLHLGGIFDGGRVNSRFSTEVWRFDAVPQPTVTPLPTPTPTLTPSPSPSASSTPSPSPTSSLTPSPSASPSLTSSPTASPSATPSPSLSPTASPSLTPSLSPTASPTPSLSPAPTATPTASPTAEPTLSPSPSPEPHAVIDVILGVTGSTAIDDTNGDGVVDAADLVPR